MSSQFERGSIVSEETTVDSLVPGALLAVSVAWFALGIAGVFKWIKPAEGVFGVDAGLAYGVGLLVLGLGMLAVGVTSRLEILETDPDRSAGLVPAVLLGGVGFVAGGLVASQTLGFGWPVWPILAVLAAAGTALVTVYPREDVGTMLPVGVLALTAALAFLLDVVGISWTWAPTGLEATFTGPVVLPALTAFVCLVAGWSSAKAWGGFGATGRQRGAYLLIGLNAAGMLGVLFLVVQLVVTKGYETVLTGASLSPFKLPFVTNVSQGIYIDVPGIMPAILGTLWLIVGAVVVAVPVGVGAAVFLTEYAEQGRFTALVEVATNGLWSTPSIVFGLFGLAFLVPRLGNGSSLISGMLVLSFMLMPLVVITSRESIKSVPDEYRDASAALGVSKWETIRSVVIPAAIPGVITGVILGVGRIAGETAPILLVMTSAPFMGKNPNVLQSFSLSASPPFIENPALMNSASALPYQLYATITSGRLPGNNEMTANEFGWGVALVLLVVVLGLYGIGIATRLHFRRKLQQ